MSVFATDGNRRNTLALVRALGLAGVSVSVGESSAGSLASHSRFCRGDVVYPCPASQTEQFQQFMLDLVRKAGFRCIIPTSDLAINVILPIRNELERWTSLPFPQTEWILKAQDKWQVVHAASNLGIAIPKSYSPSTVGELKEISKRLTYPAVVKPRFSVFQRNGTWLNGSVRYAGGPSELLSLYCQYDDRPPGALIQEKVGGDGYGVFVLLWNGQVLGAFCHRRLREKPPWGGISVYRESIPPDSHLVAKSVELLRAHQWQGVAMVEYKYDQNERVAKIMEINGRFWGSLQLAIDSGVNFPLMLYRAAVGEHPAPYSAYRHGVRSRWTIGLLESFLLELRFREKMSQVNRATRCISNSLLSFVSAFSFNVHSEVLRWNDPVPGLCEYRAYAFRGVRWFRAKLDSGILRLRSLLPFKGATPGLEVVLMGVDGTGKTSISQRLQALPFPVTVIYMGNKDFQTRVARIAFSRNLPPPFTRLVLHWERLCKRTRGTFLRARGHVVLYDRHPLERLVLQPRSWRGRFSRAIFQLYGRPVDLAFFLEGRYEALYERKREQSPELLRTMDSRLRKVIEELGIPCERIDVTTHNLEEVTRLIATRILHHLRNGKRAGVAA